jgi:hypothetical protein
MLNMWLWTQKVNKFGLLTTPLMVNLLTRRLLFMLSFQIIGEENSIEVEFNENQTL